MREQNIEARRSAMPPEAYFRQDALVFGMNRSASLKA